MQQSVVFANFTSLKSKTALPVARKTAWFDSAFRQHVCRRLLANIPIENHTAS